MRRQLNKDTRVNLASSGLFSAADYLQVRAGCTPEKIHSQSMRYAGAQAYRVSQVTGNDWHLQPALRMQQASADGVGRHLVLATMCMSSQHCEH